MFPLLVRQSLQLTLRIASKSGQVEEHLMAVVVSGKKGRQYFEPQSEDIELARQKLTPNWKPEVRLSGSSPVHGSMWLWVRNFWGIIY